MRWSAADRIWPGSLHQCYENRIPELQLTNDTLTDDIAAIVDEADLDEDHQGKLERELSSRSVYPHCNRVVRRERN
jgi:hypothetical protein